MTPDWIASCVLLFPIGAAILAGLIFLLGVLIGAWMVRHG